MSKISLLRKGQRNRQSRTFGLKVLNVDHVGIYDNFFDLGGHSLLLAQVHSELRELFEKEIPLIRMFEYTTVHGLAQYFDAQPADNLLAFERENQLRKMKEGKNRVQQRMRQRVNLGEINEEV